VKGSDRTAFLDLVGFMRYKWGRGILQKHGLEFAQQATWANH